MKRSVCVGLMLSVVPFTPAMLIHNQLPLPMMWYKLANPTIQRPGGVLYPGDNTVAINQKKKFILRMTDRIGSPIVTVVQRPDDRHPYCVGMTVVCQFQSQDTEVTLSPRWLSH